MYLRGNYDKNPMWLIALARNSILIVNLPGIVSNIVSIFDFHRIHYKPYLLMLDWR